MCNYLPVLIVGAIIGTFAMVFLIAYLLTKYVSLGSVLGALTFVVGFAVLYHDNFVVMGCGIFMGLLSIFMHRENISRLLKGQERKTDLFGKGKKKS